MKTKISLIVVVFSFFFTTAQNQNLTQQFDDIVAQYYNDADAPGATVLVAKNGKAIYRKAVGKSNLELDVDMIPENVFMLASITKQFTAVSILILEEQGKLSLEDPITKFIPDYPTRGKTITVHHLLNHTSGIKSYTSIGDLRQEARQDKTLDELIDFFKNEPMDFNPGENYSYNNSGYVLLGKIIEVLSGETYADFIDNHIFKPLGMKASQYGSHSKIIKNRAMPYEEKDNSYINASYLSMSIPHAAGALTSTIDDMLKWQNALTNNTLIKASSLQKAINGSQLNNGEHIDYGYGLEELTLKGSKGYTHSGGIFGTSTDGIYLIDEDVYVIGLSNCSCNYIEAVTTQLAAAAIGKPYPSLKDVVRLNEEQLKKWVGAYQFEDGAIRHIFYEDGALKSMRESETNTVFDIYPLSENRFMFPDGAIEYKFSVNNNGKKEVIFTANEEIIGIETDKKKPKEKEVVSLDEDILNTYGGTYELAPNFNVDITVKGNEIYAQATGQGQFQLFAENETTFFAKVTALRVVFNKDASGKVESFTLYQGGQETIAKKIE